MLLTAASMIAPQAASAGAVPCTQPVSDLTAKHVLGNTSQLQAAVSKLDKMGAQVHVVAVQRANVNSYYRQAVQYCKNWQNVTGRPVANLVVIVLAMNHQIGTYYGAEWHKALDGSFSNINDDMGAQFRDGKFAGGLTLGVNEVSDKIHNQLHPPPPTPWGKYFEIAGGALLVILIFGSIIGLAVSSHNKRERAETARRRAQDDALESYGRASTVAGHLVELKDSAGLAATALANRCGKLYLPDLHSRADEAQKDGQTAREEYDALASRPNGTPELDSLSTEAYQGLDADYSSILPRLRAAEDELVAVEGLLTTEFQRVDESTETLNQLQQIWERAHRDVAELKKQGFRLSQVDEQLALVGEAFDKGGKAMRDSDYGQIMTSIEAAQTGLKEATEQLDLPRQKPQMDETLRSLSSQLESVKASQKEAETQLDQLMAEFDSEDLADFGHEIEKNRAQMAAVDTALERCNAYLSMEKQEWTQARTLLDKIGSTFVAVTQTATAINGYGQQQRKARADLKVKLPDLKDNAEAAADNLDRLGGYDQASGDVEGIITSVNRLQQQVDAAPKQDYLRILDQVERLQKKLEQTLDDFRRRHESRVRRAYSHHGGYYHTPSTVYSAGGMDTSGLMFLGMMTGDQTLVDDGMLLSGNPLLTFAALDDIERQERQASIASYDSGGGFSDFGSDFGGGGGSWGGGDSGGGGGSSW